MGNLVNPYRFGSTGPLNFLQMIEAAGEADDLMLCLDAASALSYDPNSEAWANPAQRWRDLTGSGRDWWRGSSSSAQGSDPTFNGTPGGLSANEFWSFNGSQFFRWVSSHSQFDSWHKNNAKFSWLCLYRPPTLSGTTNPGATTQLARLFSNGGVQSGAGNTGIQISLNSRSPDLTAPGNNINLRVAGGSGGIERYNSGAGFDQFFLSPAGQDAVQFMGFSIDEAIEDGFTGVVNNQFDVRPSEYNSPSSGSPTNPAIIGANWTESGGFLNAGTRLYAVAAWDDRKLSNAGFSAILTQARARYTSLPAPA